MLICFCCNISVDRKYALTKDGLVACSAICAVELDRLVALEKKS